VLYLTVDCSHVDAVADWLVRALRDCSKLCPPSLTCGAEGLA
jgi:hypothetical protein